MSAAALEPHAQALASDDASNAHIAVADARLRQRLRHGDRPSGQLTDAEF